MRIATLILGLLLMLPLSLQSCALAGLSSVVGKQDTVMGGAIGLLMALLWIIGAAFALGRPSISTGCFVISGLLGLVGANTGFSDLTVWAIVSFGLAILAFLGRRELQSKRDREGGRPQPQA